MFIIWQWALCHMLNNKMVARFNMIQHITQYYKTYEYELKPTDSNQRWVSLSQFESSTSRQPKKGNSLLLHTSDPNLDGWAEAGTACPQKRKHHPSLYGNLPAPLETPTISQGKSAAGYVDIRFRSW